MLKHNITAASDAIRALLTTLLGQKALLRAGTLQVLEPDDIQGDVKPLLGLVPENGNFAVTLDPGWLPLIAGLKLGVETKVGDPDYDAVAIELAERFFEIVAEHFANLGTSINAGSFTVKEPGDPLPETCFGEENGKIPFFMEWKGQLMHGMVIVAMDRIESTLDEEALASAPAPVAELPDFPGADPGGLESLPDTPANEAESIASIDLPDGAANGTRTAATPASHTAANPASPGVGSQSRTPRVESAGDLPQIQSAAFPDLGSETIAPSASGDLGMLAEVELDVTVELGRRRMPLADILRLTSGSVIELEKLVGEPLQVFANNRLIAEGEAVVIDDQFGVRITSLASRVAGKHA